MNNDIEYIPHGKIKTFEKAFNGIEYFNVFKQFEAFPDCVIYEAHSNRGPGKTYGFMWGCYERGIKYIYMKRTQIDIDIIQLDSLNPLKPINRDHGTEMHFDDFTLSHGDKETKVDGIKSIKEHENILGYAVARSAITKFKGMDMSEVEYICFDEYIPQQGERLNHRECESLLDFVQTVTRDRLKRGLPPVKLVLFANTTEIFCPITDGLRIVDEIAEMQDRNAEFCHIKDRGIILQHIPYDETDLEADPWYRCMAGTPWAEASFKGKFAFNDFSRVKKIPLKGMICFCSVLYNERKYYIYRHKENGLFYMCRAKGVVNDEYDLNIEADRRRFYLTYALTLKNEISDGNMFFSDYSAYNLIFNYNKIYKNL